MKTTVIGAYPKISDEHQELRRALHRHDRGELDEAGLAGVLDESTRWAMGELEWAGIDVINDGQVRWDDLLAPFARAWEGCERGPLERFYDNNTYFRQPVITGPITTKGTTLVRDFEFAKGAVRGQLKAAVCGPLTFATLTAEDRHYRSLEERTMAVADAIAEEIRGLGAAGATLVDVEEPALVAHPEHFALARAAIERLAAASVPLALQAYFFPADPLLDALAAFPVAQVGIDVRSRETHVLDKLTALRQTVVLGIVDARNTRVESERELAGLIDAALKRIPVDYLWLAPTTGLEYLPHDVAVQKLKVLVAAAHATGGVKA
jgi:5-methyltetrahydropteroyltriglutamate--homocysteine methyltransferase